MIKKHHDKKFIFDFNQRIISNLNHDLDLEQFLLFKKMLINIKNKIVTFTGFNGVNKLSKLGNLNFIVDSKSYNIIENIHQIWLTMMIDLIYGSPEYIAKI